MTPIAIDLLVVVFAAICLYHVELTKPIMQAVHKDYLSVETGTYVRGLLSVVVLFHHLSMAARGWVLFTIFSKLGYLTVAVFFFLSGYGLMKQYVCKQGYARHFLLRRLPPVLIPYVIATVLYYFLYQFLGEPWSVRAVFKGFLSGTPIVTASWYIICILLFYVAFWLLMHLCGSHHKWMVCGAMLYCAAYVLFCKNRGYGSWWYNTAPVLVLGMFWALHEKKIDALFQKKYWTISVGTAALFVTVYAAKILLRRLMESNWLSLMMTWCVAALFACCVLMVLMKMRLRNPILQYLGERSLEIYLSHYLFIQLFRTDKLPRINDFFYVILVVVCTIVFSHLFHYINQKILKGYMAFLAKNIFLPRGN